jgi:hypothetical protein
MQSTSVEASRGTGHNCTLKCIGKGYITNITSELCFESVEWSHLTGGLLKKSEGPLDSPTDFIVPTSSCLFNWRSKSASAGKAWRREDNEVELQKH